MSEIRSALPGAVFDGAVRVEEAGAVGMVTLRGDLGDGRLRDAVREVSGVDVPPASGSSLSENGGVCWMAPDELLILCAHGEADAVAARLSDALAGTHHLAVNVSDARVMFRVSGDGAIVRDIIAKITPADLRAPTLGTGTVRRTRLQQVPAAFWFREPDMAEVVAFRSVADYIFGLLSNAADAGPVGHF